MTTRDAIHALVDELDEAELDRAKDALETLAIAELTDVELEELQRRSDACRRGEVVDARAFMAKLRGASADSDR